MANYKVKLLKPSGNDPTNFSRAFAININSVVAGCSRIGSKDRAVLWLAGEEDPLVLPTDSQHDSYAVAINDNDQVVGITEYGSDKKPWFFDLNTNSMHNLASYLGWADSRVMDINNAGIIALNHNNKAYTFDASLLGSFSPDSPLFDLSNAVEGLSGSGYTYATAVNNGNGKGKVAGIFSSIGYNGFLYDLEESNLIDVGQIIPYGQGAMGGWIYDVNKNGRLTGVSSWEAFECNTNDPGLNFEGFNLPPNYQNYSVEPYCINDNRDIVGGMFQVTGNLPNPQSALAFVIKGNSIAHTVKILNDISEGPGWDLSYATSINNKGQIVGFGSYNGVERGFLLEPVIVISPPKWWFDPGEWISINPHYKYGIHWKGGIYPGDIPYPPPIDVLKQYLSRHSMTEEEAKTLMEQSGQLRAYADAIEKEFQVKKSRE